MKLEILKYNVDIDTSMANEKIKIASELATELRNALDNLKDIEIGFKVVEIKPKKKWYKFGK